MPSGQGEAPVVILGVSAGFHDAAAALLIDGRIEAAVEEERLTRIKHDASFPTRAMDCCVEIAGIAPSDINLVAYHEKPVDTTSRHLTSRLRSGPTAARGLLTSTPSVLRKQLLVGHHIDRWFRDRGHPSPPLAVAEHHASHAAAAFFASPFRDAAILTIDGVGEWATSTIADGRGHAIATLRELRFPDSVGLLYSAFTEYCGLRVNSGEGELMGLAALGQPRWVDEILFHLVDLHPDGSIQLDQRYFSYLNGATTTNRRFHALFGGPPTPLDQPPTEREADLAASIQEVIERIVLAMARTANELTGHRSLCLAGGVALNCIANARILEEGPFDEVWVQPAAGDSGNALGAALWAWHQVLGNERGEVDGDAMQGAFLGPAFAPEEIDRWLADERIEHQRFPSRAGLCEAVAARLDHGAVIGWFQGRMEFGPRALGHRSILADPRSPEAHPRINERIKHRAAYRPLAPAVLDSRASEWFDTPGNLPYMTITARVAEGRRTTAPDDSASLSTRARAVRSEIPAVTHIDHSARIQTVDDQRNPEFSALLEAWEARTGCPVLLNTSFNGPNEPIVCTPADALRSFHRLGLDLLVIEDRLIEAP